MSEKTTMYLNLPDEVRRMARMAAARAGKSLSEYVTNLIIGDARETGIAALVERSDEGEEGR